MVNLFNSVAVNTIRHLKIIQEEWEEWEDQKIIN